MSNRKENRSGQDNRNTNSQQDTEQTGLPSPGAQRKDQDQDTSRTSSEGRKLASGGNKNIKNREERQ